MTQIELPHHVSTVSLSTGEIHLQFPGQQEAHEFFNQLPDPTGLIHTSHNPRQTYMFDLVTTDVIITDLFRLEYMNNWVKLFRTRRSTCFSRATMVPKILEVEDFR